MQLPRFIARQTLTQTAIVVMSLAVGIFALCPSWALAAPEPLTIVKPTDAATQTGRPYGEWSALWWQRMLSLNNDQSPVLDTSGRNCTHGDTPEVFFLAGDAGGAVSRRCTIPADKPLFLPILNTECSNVEAVPFFGGNDDELGTCARRLIDGVGLQTLTASVDGVAVADLASYRAPSPVFSFSMPSRNNFLGLNGVTRGRSAADGYYLLSGPPAPGKHTLQVGGSVVSGPGADFSVSITYSLFVEPPTFTGVCTLSRQFVSNRGMAAGMCTVLDAAHLNDELHVLQGKAGQLGAYRSMVGAAQRAQFISAQNAATLTRLSTFL
jgi:hypothetical protein